MASTGNEIENCGLSPFSAMARNNGIAMEFHCYTFCVRNTIRLLRGSAGETITGSLAATEAAESLSSSATVLVSATLSATEADDTLSSAAAVSVSAALAAAEVNDTLSALAAVVSQTQPSILGGMSPQRRRKRAPRIKRQWAVAPGQVVTVAAPRFEAGTVSAHASVHGIIVNATVHFARSIAHGAAKRTGLEASAQTDFVFGRPSGASLAPGVIAIENSLPKQRAVDQHNLITLLAA